MTGAPRVAVVGAGITGLVAAFELASRGAQVEVFERWPDVGGQASAFDIGGGLRLERYYHHLFESDTEMAALHERFLPGELEWHRSSVGMFVGGRVRPFTTPLDLARYGAIPAADRVRLGLAVLRLTRRTDWEAMDDVPALEWLRRECGDRAVEAVWSPLLLGKFGEEAEAVPLAWLWSKLQLRRRLDGSGGRRELLGYPRHSFQRIAMVLADEVRRLGGQVHVDRTIVRVQAADGRHLLRSAPPGAYRLPFELAGPPVEGAASADIVLFTTPTDVTRRLVSWPSSYDRALAERRYRAAVVLLVELRKRFGTMYWTNIAEPDMPFLGLIEHTNLVPAGRYPAHYLYVANYVAQDSRLLRMTTAELQRHCFPGLQRVSPRFAYEDIMRCWSFREPAAQPIPRVGNRDRLLPLRTPVRGLFIGNTTQIYPEDRGTNYSVRLGREAAATIWEELQSFTARLSYSIRRTTGASPHSRSSR